MCQGEVGPPPSPKAMDKKIKLFYRISTWVIAIFISTNILVKAIIWFSSLEQPRPKDNIHDVVRFFKCPGTKYVRYTTEHKYKLFNKVDYLLTPPFVILFVVLAVKLAKTPGIFEEKG